MRRPIQSMALLSPITRMGTSVEDGWRESSRRVLLRGGAAALVEHA